MPSTASSSETADFLFELLHRQRGFSLSEEKRYLLHGRLTPLLSKHGLASLAALRQRLEVEHDGTLFEEVIDAMTTGETYFFRDASSFHDLQKTILPQLRQAIGARKVLRLWSAGCSSGQEAYSLAITLCEHTLTGSDWAYHILATDISNAAITRARLAVYSQFEVERGVDESLRRAYFTRADNETWRLKERIRQWVRVNKHNLLTPLESSERFDLILCRNVLIYFDTPTKQRVLSLLAQQLAPHGVLMLARTDMIANLEAPLAPIPGLQAVYRRAD